MEARSAAAGDGSIERQGTLLRVVTLCGLAFLIMLGYSIARPTTESLFLEAHSARALPLVWLLVAAAVVVTVAGFSRLLARLELIRLFGLTALGSGLVLTALQLAREAQVPFVHYALYVWKDLYIVLLVETFYCYTNAVFPIRTARWIYGLFGVCSSTGSAVGSFAVGPLAEGLGTAVALWGVLPAAALMWLICIPFSRAAGVRRPPGEGGRAAVDFLGALRVVRGSSFLILLVLLIALVQVVVNLIDFQFNWVVEQAFPQVDQRTGVIGQVYGSIDLATLVLHALTGPLLRLLGVPAVLLAVPLLLGLGALTFMVSPRFATAAVLKVSSKALDYTIFRSAKEILYIPLSYDEKTQGKVVIDVMCYRLAKGGAALLLKGLDAVSLWLVALGVLTLVSPLTLVLIGAWLALTTAVARRFRRKVSRAQELG